MSTPASEIKDAIAAVTAMLDDDVDPNDAALARLFGEVTVSGLATVAFLLARLAAARGDETPTDVMHKIGLVVAEQELETGPGTFGT